MKEARLTKPIGVIYGTKLMASGMELMCYGVWMKGKEIDSYEIKRVYQDGRPAKSHFYTWEEMKEKLENKSVTIQNSQHHGRYR